MGAIQAFGSNALVWAGQRIERSDNAQGRLLAKAAYLDYLAWCKRNGEGYCVSQHMVTMVVGRMARDLGGVALRSNGTVFVGVRLKPAPAL